MISPIERNDVLQDEQPFFTIVHPLDDLPEEKMDIEQLGPMKMTRTIRICLFTLRAYLLLMFGLVVLRVLQLAGATGS